MADILIVDDAAFMRNSIKYIVESAGHKVVGMAKDGDEAIELYKILKPDIVTMDIMMSGVDGFSALNAIKEYDCNARVIMVTALGQEDPRELSRKLGAAGFITKPFKTSSIIEEIERVMKG